MRASTRFDLPPISLQLFDQAPANIFAYNLFGLHSRFSSLTCSIIGLNEAANCEENARGCTENKILKTRDTRDENSSSRRCRHRLLLTVMLHGQKTRCVR